MWWLMVAKKHCNDDAEETRDFRHMKVSRTEFYIENRSCEIQLNIFASELTYLEAMSTGAHSHSAICLHCQYFTKGEQVPKKSPVFGTLQAVS